MNYGDLQSVRKLHTYLLHKRSELLSYAESGFAVVHLKVGACRGGPSQSPVQAMSREDE